jgi:hypothetical protein
MINNAICNPEMVAQSAGEVVYGEYSRLLRLAATLPFTGLLLSIFAGLFHPDREYANDHVAAFTEYAHYTQWTLVHFGQFVGMAVLIAGLLVLFFALNVTAGVAGWASRAGSVSAVAALALYAVLQAVDGVALKQAVDGWMRSPAAEKAMRFASAEAIRWLEWGVRSYQSFMLGLALLLLASVIVLSAKLPKPIGYLSGVSGLAYMVQGWVIGSQGFSRSNTLPTLVGIFASVVWSLWLLIIGWRTQRYSHPEKSCPV